MPNTYYDHEKLRQGFKCLGVEPRFLLDSDYGTMSKTLGELKKECRQDFKAGEKNLLFVYYRG